MCIRDSSIADIVSGKVSSDDLAKYGISANVLDGLKNSGNGLPVRKEFV